MKTKVVLFLILTFFVTSLSANNVQLAGTVNIISAAGGTVTMEVDLSWDNSWRDDYNWDAVWLFFKYKQGVDGAWQHAAINASTATVTGGDYTVMSATTASTVPGLFVYPSKERGGNTGTLKVQVQWGSSYTKAQFDNNDVFVVCHGIEMVYIPYGAYTIGDGSSTNAFPKQIIDSETSSLANANFPKGYQGFYIMKYETSQEQYVEFLNSLTLAQQKALIPGVENLNIGEFVFGTDRKAPNHRNSVVLSAKPAAKPFMFDNNLNNNNRYSEDTDGGTLAMNYISISDAQGYASWVGLRPMTEMEYEKACRRPYPQEPDAGEYAWNSATGFAKATGLTNVGMGSEVVVGVGNVNADNGLNGPARCGIFARPDTKTQTAAGATYWGVMEMSGNVSELCANITNTTISKTGNGTGSYSTSSWGTTPSTYGTRGGGFSDTHTTLATSDRSAVSRFTNVLQRDSSVGFRCAFTYGAAGTVDAGTIAEDIKPCPGTTVTFSGTPASATAVKITSYIWSMKINGGAYTVLSGEGGATLAYSNFEMGKKYMFQRKAICPLGEAVVETKEYTIPNTTITLNPSSSGITLCGATPVTATSSGSVYTWSYSGKSLASTATYTPSAGDFDFQSGNFEVICHTMVTGCPGEAKLPVTVAPVPSTTGCGGVITDSQGNTYTTKLMKDNRCWMTQNMRRTDVSYMYANNDAANAMALGCHYQWTVAMQNSTIEGAQGICPSGWHIPCDGEWKTLEMAYGMTKEQADATSYRGTDQGTQFKPGGSSGFNMTLSGNNGASNFGAYGHYCSSSASGSYAWPRSVYASGALVLRNTHDQTYWFSVRCVRD